MNVCEERARVRRWRYPGKKMFSFICGFLVVFLFYINLDKFQENINKFDALNELQYYMETQKNQCDHVPKKTELRLKSKNSLDEYFRKPQCDDILVNMTSGKWVAKKNFHTDLKEELKSYHVEFRKKVGIPLEPWNDNGKCGYNVLAPKISKTWPRIGTFCDPNGLEPCCTNRHKGNCVPKTTSNKCDCSTCVDTSNYKEALLSDWRTTDKKCHWVNYTSLEACAVLNKLSNGNAEAQLYFVGDSLMRNMFMGLTSILANDPKRGIQKYCLSKELQKLCEGENLFIQRPCHDLSVAYSLEVLREEQALCNGGRFFKAEYKGFGQPHQAANFVKFVKSLYGMENTFIILGVGLHFRSNQKDVQTKFLKPVLTSNSKWPKFLWVHPISIGLLKPPAFMKTQGNEALDAFADAMKVYLTMHNVPILDFRDITKGVDSYDGTHYGSGVNIMKAQVLLNYLAQALLI